MGLEPTTLRLRVSCSTDWASQAQFLSEHVWYHFSPALPFKVAYVNYLLTYLRMPKYFPSSRNWTSDLWISLSYYSPPLYQLSYQRIECVGTLNSMYWTYLNNSFSFKRTLTQFLRFANNLLSIMIVKRFELLPPKRMVPKTIALNHSATLPTRFPVK